MESLDTLLANFLRRIASNEEITVIFLRELWPQIVGKDLASKSRPLTLKTKKLLLAVPSEIWQKELTELREMLLNAINRHWELPVVEEIDFVVRPTEAG